MRMNAPLPVFHFEEGTLFAYSDFSPKSKISRYCWQMNLFFTITEGRRRFVVGKEAWTFIQNPGELYSVDRISGL